MPTAFTFPAICEAWNGGRNAFIDSECRVPMWPEIDAATATALRVYEGTELVYEVDIVEVTGDPENPGAVLYHQTNTTVLADEVTVATADSDYREFLNPTAGDPAIPESRGIIRCSGIAALGPYHAELYVSLYGDSAIEHTDTFSGTPEDGDDYDNSTSDTGNIYPGGFALRRLDTRLFPSVDEDLLATYMALAITDPLEELWVMEAPGTQAGVTGLDIGQIPNGTLIWADFDAGGTHTASFTETTVTTASGPGSPGYSGAWSTEETLLIEGAHTVTWGP